MMEIILGIIALGVVAKVLGFGKDDEKSPPRQANMEDGFVNDRIGPDWMFDQTGKSPEGYNLDDPDDMDRYLSDCP